MQVYTKGKGDVALDQRDFIAQGGEGSIYAKGKTAYKIYTDIKRMIPLVKIDELSVLTHNDIIKPEDVLYDQKHKPIGYTMQFKKNTNALCQLFPRAFKDRNKITPAMTFRLVKKLQDIVKHVHDNGLLIVDLNEMNFLFDDKFQSIFAIDVDSYQTKSFPATAIMESIRDRHSKTFSQGTDWFSFGVVSLQMMMGIHPYKGKHPTIKTLDERMEKNVSILHKDVSIPNMCYDTSVIPANFLAWLKAVLEDGKRIAPPFGDGVINIAIKVDIITGSNNFVIDMIKEYNDTIVAYYYNSGVEVVVTNTSTFLNGKDTGIAPAAVVGFTDKSNHPINVSVDNDSLKLFDVAAKRPLKIDLECSHVMTYDGRIYAKSGESIVEIKFKELGTDIIPTAKIVGKAMQNATKLFSGMAIMNMMGSYFVSIFPKADHCYQLQIKELVGYQIVDARFDSGVMIIVAVKVGKYDKFIMRLSADYQSYDMRVIKDVQTNDINFIVKGNGVCIRINEDEDVEVFPAKKDAPNMKVFKDSVINSQMELYKQGMDTLFTNGKKLYRMKSK